MARENNRPMRKPEENDGLNKKLIAVNRITKVVKGGRIMRFSALVVIGDEHGKVGCGMVRQRKFPKQLKRQPYRLKRTWHPLLWSVLPSPTKLSVSSAEAPSL